MIWLASFVALPAPISPQRVTLEPMAARMSFTRSNASCLPPHMNASVPSTAFGSPPDTGASTMNPPFFSTSAQISIEAAGLIELVSTRIMPGRIPSRTPSLPSTASLTCGEFCTIVNTTSLFSATSRAEAAPFAPSATISATVSARCVYAVSG